MDNLIHILESVSEKILNYRSLYEANEMSVRAHLIDPVIRELGWDPSNPHEVQQDIYTEEGKPDYTLIL